VADEKIHLKEAWIGVLVTYLSRQTGRCVEIKHCFINCGEIIEDIPPPYIFTLITGMFLRLKNTGNCRSGPLSNGSF